MRKDQAILNEANRLNEIEKQKQKDKQDNFKRKLKEMNIQRDEHLKQQAEAWSNYK